MVIMGLDSSGEDLLLGLAMNRHVAGTRQISAKRRHSEFLPGEIIRLLSENDLTLTDVEGFTFVSGPGSYTGLRVGAATIMGLATMLDVPAAALSSFEFLRCIYQTDERKLGCIIPCRSEYYYWRTYLPGDDSGSSVDVLTAVEILRSLEGTIRIVGPKTKDIEQHSSSSSSVSIELIDSPTPDAGGLLACWGQGLIEAGQVVDWDDWQLDYGPAPGFRKWSKPTRST